MICESRGLDRVCQSTSSMYYNVADSVFPMLALQSAAAAGQAYSSPSPLPAIHGELHLRTTLCAYHHLPLRGYISTCAEFLCVTS